jgi:hypothetical protein
MTKNTRGRIREENMSDVIDLNFKAVQFIVAWRGEGHDYKAIVDGVNDGAVLKMYNISEELAEEIEIICRDRIGTGQNGRKYQKTLSQHSPV